MGRVACRRGEGWHDAAATDVPDPRCPVALPLIVGFIDVEALRDPRDPGCNLLVLA